MITRTSMPMREFETVIYEALEKTGMYIPVDAEIYDVYISGDGVVIQFTHQTTEEDDD